MYPIEFFWRAAERHSERPAILGPETLTFRALARRVREQGEALVAQDPTVGARVAIAADNTVEHLIGILAVLAAGKTWIPLNPRQGDPELARQIAFLRPSLVLADATMADRLAAHGPRLLADRNGSAPLPRDLRLPLHATQAIKLTGGSTGAPKGVAQPYRAWNTNVITQMAILGLSPASRYLVAAPLTHGTSTYILPVLGSGGALVFPDAPKPAGLLDAAEKHGATLFFAPPTLVFALVDEQRHEERRLSLKNLVYGGAPMRPSKIREAQACFGPVLCTSYGQTEAPQVIAFLPPEEMNEATYASVGRPTFLTEVGILDKEGHVLAAGAEGEIAVRGDLLMTGYIDAPEETARVMQDGWLRTGDAGVLDEHGYLFLRDRIRDVIITGGFNVYPSDVEAALAKEPAIADCSVVGVPDEKWGEAVHAAIQLRPGHPLDADGLKAAIKHALGAVMTPKEFHLFPTLPRTAVGKVSKPAIREEILRRKDKGN